MDLSDIIESTILYVLAVSSLIGILDHVGFLPPFIRKRLHRNRADDILNVLEELGIVTRRTKVKNESFNYPSSLDRGQLTSVTKSGLDKIKISNKVAVGKNRSIEIKYYYNLIGASCSEIDSKYFASMLSNYWYILVKENDYSADYSFDFIVTPKGGSPILGYEFSKIANKPFILHESVPRFKGDESDMRSVFDCHNIPPAGSIALIIDDSTTGGTMVCNTIIDLRKYGYNVYFCLVVFEPVVKDAFSRIKNMGVSLLSIIKTHN